MKEKDFRRKKQAVAKEDKNRKKLQNLGRAIAKQFGYAYRTRPTDDGWKLVTVKDSSRKQTEEATGTIKTSKRKTTSTLYELKKITKQSLSVLDKYELFKKQRKEQLTIYEPASDESNEEWVKITSKWWRSLSDKDRETILLDEPSIGYVQNFSVYDKPKGFINELTKKDYYGFKLRLENVVLDGMLESEFEARRMEVKKGLTYELVEMTPDEYLRMCEENRSGWYRSTHRKEDVHKYAQAMKNGAKFPLPYIRLDGGSQEGRHRALAYKLLAIEKDGYYQKWKMPVMIIKEYDYWTEPFYRKLEKKFDEK